MNSNSLSELRARSAAIRGAMMDTTDHAAAQNRDLTVGEQLRFDGCAEDLRSLNVEIGKEMSRIDRDLPTAAVGATRATSGLIISMRDRRDGDPCHGFARFGEFAQCVRQASMPSRSTRLTTARFNSAETIG